MKAVKAVKNILQKPRYMLRNVKYVARMVTDPTLSQSYYPEEKRKNKIQIYVENLTWLARYREPNRYYYVYGFDRKYGANTNEYLPYPIFKSIRNNKNFKPIEGETYNYVCILRDKFVFSQFLMSLGFPTPPKFSDL